MLGVFYPEKRPSQVSLPGETSQSDMLPRRDVPGFVTWENYPSQVSLPGEASQADLSPRRGVPGFFSREKRPSQISLPGEASQSNLSPRRGVLKVSLLTSRRNAYSRTKYLDLNFYRTFRMRLEGLYINTNLLLLASFCIRIAFLCLFRTFHLSSRTVGHDWGRICSFVLDSPADSSDSSMNVEHLVCSECFASLRHGLVWRSDQHTWKRGFGELRWQI